MKPMRIDRAEQLDIYQLQSEQRQPPLKQFSANSRLQDTDIGISPTDFETMNLGVRYEFLVSLFDQIRFNFDRGAPSISMHFKCVLEVTGTTQPNKH